MPDNNLPTGDFVVFVTGLNKSITIQNLEDFVKKVSEPERVNYRDGKSYAHLHFSTNREAENVIRTLNLAPPFNLGFQWASKKVPLNDTSISRLEDQPPLSPDDFVSSPSADHVEEMDLGSCFNCSKNTSSRCKDCDMFFCSVYCMAEQANQHISFCNKLVGSSRKPTEERRSIGRGTMEPSRSRSPPKKYPLGFYTRFQVDESKRPINRSQEQGGNRDNSFQARGDHSESKMDDGQSRRSKPRFPRRDSQPFQNRDLINSSSTEKRREFSDFHSKENSSQCGESRRSDPPKLRQNIERSSFQDKGKFRSNGNIRGSDEAKFRQNSDGPKFNNDSRGNQRHENKGWTAKSTASQDVATTVGNTHLVVALVAENDGYWVLGTDKNEIWTEVQDLLNKGTLKRLATKAYVNLVCAAKYEEIWFRVRVVSIQPLSVHYIDYGNKSECNESDLRELPIDVTETKIPALVRFIKLTNGATLIIDKVSKIRCLGGDKAEIVDEISGPQKTATEKHSVPNTPKATTVQNSKKAPSSTSEALSETKKPAAEKCSVPDTPKATTVQNAKIPPSSTSEALSETKGVKAQASPVKSEVSTQQRSSASVASLKAMRSVIDVLSVGSKAVGMVSSVQSNGVVLTVTPSELKKSMLSIMNLKLENCSSIECTVGGIGDLVAVKAELSPDCDFARGLVIDSNEEKDRVALVDLGSEIAVKDVYRLPDEFLDLPAMACVFISQEWGKLENPSLVNIVVLEKEEKGYRCKISDGDDARKSCEGVLMPWKPRQQAFIESGEEVIITCTISPSQLYIVSGAVLNSSSFRDILSAVGALSDEPALKKMPGIHEIVAAKFTDNLFYRARVVSHKEGKAEVRFIDYGNIALISMEDLRELPEHLCSYPAAAVYVKLLYVPDSTFSQELEVINDAVINGTFFKVMYDNIKLGVVLKNTVTGSELNAEVKKVIEKSLAAKIEKCDIGAEIGEEEIRMIKLPLKKEVKIQLTYIDHMIFKETGQLFCWNPHSPDVARFSELNETLNSYCNELPSDRYRPRVGELCAANYEGEWARCSCLCTDPVTLLFIDYGNFAKVETNFVRKLPDNFKESAALAVECYIKAFEKADTVPKRQKLFDALQEKIGLEVTATISERDGYSYYLSDIPEVDEILNS